jgi:LacI family transcriptional regulator
MAKVTQRLIARKAGVSPTTVCLVLSGRANTTIAEETRKHVLTTAADLGYHPAISPNRTGNIGYLFGRGIKAKNPYYHRFFTGIHQELENSDFHLLTAYLDPIEHLPTIVRLGKTDGLIVQGRVGADWLKEATKVMPVVVLNYAAEGNLADSVVSDNVGGMEKVFSYLHSLGHRRIAFFGMKPFAGMEQERLDGYLRSLKKHGLPEEPDYIVLPEAVAGSLGEVNECVKKALLFWRGLRTPPSAVMTMGDVYGAPMVKIAQQLGIRVPEDISITGSDNTESAHMVSPSLTTINEPLEEMARCAVRLLLERISGCSRTPCRCVRFDMDLVINQSTGK